MMRKDKDYLGIIMDRRRLSEYSLPFYPNCIFIAGKIEIFLKSLEWFGTYDIDCCLNSLADCC